MPQSPWPASSAAANSTIDSSIMPTSSKITAMLLSLVVMIVDPMMSAAWMARRTKVWIAAPSGVYVMPNIGWKAGRPGR